MPRLVFLTDGDNRILLDIANPEHQLEIIAKIKKGIRVVLVEKFGQEKGEWIKSERGVHFAEFVVPFLKNKKYCQASDKIYIPKPSSPAHRWKLPGSEWLYAKLS